MRTSGVLMFRVLNNLRKLSPICEFTWSRYANTVKKAISTCNKTNAKLYHDGENAYAYRILSGSIQTKQYPFWETSSQDIISQDAFNNALDQNFRMKSITEIVNTFQQVQPFCKHNNLKISDNRFDQLVDGLMDKAEKLTDEELISLLDVLKELPACDSLDEHNFHDMWSCLDDMCCRRIPRWDPEMLFAVSDRWFKMNMGKVCDFIFEALDKMSRKPEKRLTKDQLVNAFFFMNIARKRSVSFEYEYALHLKMDEMSVDELAIVALGYFKTQSKIKIPQIITEMLRKAKNAEDVHEISLCAILKIVRFATHPIIADQVLDFLEHITPKLENFSTLCVLHAALLGTSLQLEYRPVLKLAAQRIASNITNVEEVRLKDIERILLALTMFDYNPETEPCIFKVCMEELHAEQRNFEVVKYHRCLGYALSYLSIKNIYSVELLGKILDPDYISEVYCNSPRGFPRELFVLDSSIDIEVPDYKGPRLDAVKRRKVAKWLTEFTPTLHQQKKITAAEKLILNVHQIVEEIVSGAENMFIEHVLPQYPRADIVICRNKSTKRYEKPIGFDSYILGDIMKPQDTTKYDFYAIIVVGWNNTIRNTTKPVGMINMKFRHLEKIGFKPVTVIWNEFGPLSPPDKRKYIENKIEAVK